VHGVPVLWLPDARFKSFRASLVLQRPLDGRTAARALLPSLLVEGTEHYQDRVQLQRAQERLYGAVATPGTGRLGETTVLRLLGEGVAGDFLPGRPDQIGGVLALLAELLLRPRLHDGGFADDVFVQQQAQLLAAARAVADDKAAFARQRALELGCVGEPYAVPDHGGQAAIAALDRWAVEGARNDFLQHGRSWCVAMGALPADLPSRLEGLLAALPARPNAAPLPAVEPARRAPRSAVEYADAVQSKQVLLFRSKRPAQRELCALHAMVSLFGGGPHSRLFQQVREKQSLAYYASAGVDHHKGVLLVQAGIDVGRGAAVQAAVEGELAALARGDFTDTELATAIAQITGALPAIDDSLAARMQYTGEQWLLGNDQTPTQRLASYAAVRRDDVVAAAASVWLDFAYLLEAKGAAA
jgi:predicted Zn-dependent peptidase